MFNESHQYVSSAGKLVNGEGFWAVAERESHALLDAAFERLPLNLLKNTHRLNRSYIEENSCDLGAMELYPLVQRPNRTEYPFDVTRVDISFYLNPFHTGNSGLLISLESSFCDGDDVLALQHFLKHDEALLGTLLSLAPIKLSCRQKPEGKRTGALSVVDRLKHAVKKSLARENLNSMNMADGTLDLKLSVSPTTTPGTFQAALAVLLTLVVACQVEAEEKDGGRRIINALVTRLLDLGCRPGARGINQGRQTARTPSGNDGFDSDKPLWLRLTNPAGYVKSAFLRCNTTHTMLAVMTKHPAATYHSDCAHFLPSRRSRRAALTAAKRIVTAELRQGAVPGHERRVSEWEEFVPEPNTNFKTTHTGQVRNGEIELYNQLEGEIW